eukprot:358186-Chlamydomonas_euryale.AAC.2
MWGASVQSNWASIGMPGRPMGMLVRLMRTAHFESWRSCTIASAAMGHARLLPCAMPACCHAPCPPAAVRHARLLPCAMPACCHAPCPPAAMRHARLLPCAMPACCHAPCLRCAMPACCHAPCLRCAKPACCHAPCSFGAMAVCCHVPRSSTALRAAPQRRPNSPALVSTHLKASPSASTCLRNANHAEEGCKDLLGCQDGANEANDLAGPLPSYGHFSATFAPPGSQVWMRLCVATVAQREGGLGA